MNRNDFILACKQMRIYRFDWGWDIVDEYRYNKIDKVPHTDGCDWWISIDGPKTFKRVIDADGVLSVKGVDAYTIYVLANNYEEALEIANNYFKANIMTKADMKAEIEDKDNCNLI